MAWDVASAQVLQSPRARLIEPQHRDQALLQYPDTPETWCHAFLGGAVVDISRGHASRSSTAGKPNDCQATSKRKSDTQSSTEPGLLSPSYSYFQELLEVTGVLVAGTIESTSRAVDIAAKAEALALVPYLRPCLTVRARYYGHGRAGGIGAVSADTYMRMNNSDDERTPTNDSTGGSRDYQATTLRALEEMVSRHFPLDDSREPREGSEEATAYALLLRGLLNALVRWVQAC